MGETEITRVKNTVIRTDTGHKAIFPGKRESLNNTVKNSVIGTNGTVLFSWERGRTEYMFKSKITLTVNRVPCYFPRKVKKQK